MNVEAHQVANQRYYRKIRLRALHHYSSGTPQCACCKETRLEFLSLDHIDGGGTQHRKTLGRGGTSFYLWLYRMNYPIGFRVLCYNCHFSMNYYGYCPHIGYIANTPAIAKQLPKEERE